MSVNKFGLIKAFPGVANSTTANQNARFNRHNNINSEPITKRSKAVKGFDVALRVDVKNKGEKSENSKSVSKRNSEAYTKFAETSKNSRNGSFISLNELNSKAKLNKKVATASTVGSEGGKNSKAETFANIALNAANKTSKQGFSVADAVLKRGAFEAKSNNGANPPKALDVPPISIDKKKDASPNALDLKNVGKVRVLNIHHKDFDANNFTGVEKSILKVASLLKDNKVDYLAEHRSEMPEAVYKNNNGKKTVKGLYEKDSDKDFSDKGLAKGHELEAANLNAAKALGKGKGLPDAAAHVAKDNYVARQDQKLQDLTDKGLLV